MGVELSIVICSRNRAQNLGETLSSLARIETKRSWEVLVVDNASTDGTADVLEAFDDLGGRLRTMQVLEIGLGNARDIAWRNTSGAVVAFTDDDCYPERDYVDKILKVFDQDPGLACVGGRILLHDPNDYPITIDEREVRVDIAPFQFIPAGTLQGANIALRRKALEQIGGFDRDLGAGTPFPCEDVDVVAAVAWAGLRSAFDPRPVVRHHHRRKAPDVPILMKSYDYGRGAYYAKYLLKRECRAAYLSGWKKSRLLYVHGDSLRSFLRELASARRYLVHRGAYSLLFMLTLVALVRLLHLTILIVLHRLKRLTR
ncbi:glycosyltransferase [Methylobacterium sp. Leaf361]|uniref:glycosyltransferase n=1 Tax=Methylobacterium sp. Leaf361 TaxID=1736352 RepID=UPI0009E8B9BD|nr:glycosyltransferase [Methylobacterium sp. Leaf361]